MSKALSIRKEAEKRIVASGIAKTVVRGRRLFSSEELPGICIYMDRRDKDSRQGQRIKFSPDLVIEYFHATDPQIENDDLADAMIAQIQAAMEVEPMRLAGDIVLSPGIDYQSDDIEYPDDAGGQISVIVRYAVPHIEAIGE